MVFQRHALCAESGRWPQQHHRGLQHNHRGLELSFRIRRRCGPEIDHLRVGPSKLGNVSKYSIQRIGLLIRRFRPPGAGQVRQRAVPVLHVEEPNIGRISGHTGTVGGRSRDGLCSFGQGRGSAHDGWDGCALGNPSPGEEAVI